MKLASTPCLLLLALKLLASTHTLLISPRSEAGLDYLDTLLITPRSSEAAGLHTLPPPHRTATHAHAGCLPKAGYTMLVDAQGDESKYDPDLSQAYQTAPASAEASCNADPHCTLWDDSGRYLVGKVDMYSRAPGRCTYVKNGDWGNGVCSCLPTYVVGGGLTSAGVTSMTYTGCTELLWPRKPWCLTHSSCSASNWNFTGADGRTTPAIFCTSGPGISNPLIPPTPPTPPRPRLPSEFVHTSYHVWISRTQDQSAMAPLAPFLLSIWIAWSSYLLPAAIHAMSCAPD